VEDGEEEEEEEEVEEELADPRALGARHPQALEQSPASPAHSPLIPPPASLPRSSRYPPPPTRVPPDETNWTTKGDECPCCLDNMADLDTLEVLRCGTYTSALPTRACYVTNTYYKVTSSADPALESSARKEARAVRCAGQKCLPTLVQTRTRFRPEALGMT